MDLIKFSKKRICIAVSGGVDSIALLHFLLHQREKYDFEISAIHCEHGIRGVESLSDKRFVEEICLQWQIPLYCFSENCMERSRREKCSLETVARKFRYESFASVIKENKADYIATAHHENDEAETVLFRLARGTSLLGMRGIEEERVWLIRPFLHWTREEIEIYAKENRLRYCVDSTNLEKDATRNKLRIDVLPKLEEAVKGATSNLAHFATLAAEDDALLYAYSQSLFLKTEQGYAVVFSDKKPLFTRACLMAMKALGIEKDYTAKHLEALFALQNSERGAVLYLPQNVIAKRGKNHIDFYIQSEVCLEEKANPEKFNKNGFDGGRYALKLSSMPFEQEQSKWKILKIDADKVPKNAVFRFRKEGDKITCFGGGTKTLKKFFNEREIPVEERGYLPLIASEDSEEIYVICGVEISEQVKITQTTKNILYISIQKE